MREWLLPIGAAALLSTAEVGILLCTGALGAFAHMLVIGALTLAVGTVIYCGRRLVRAKVHPGGRRPAG